VCDTLKTTLSLTAAQCEVMFGEGMPRVRCGQVFLSVVEGEWRNVDPPDWGISEYFGFRVVVTRRIGSWPLDRIGTKVLTDASAGLIRRLCQVRSVLHKSLDVIKAANVYIKTEFGDSNGFIEPPVFRWCEASQIKGANWLHSAGPDMDDEDGREEAALVRTAVFYGARRVQRIVSMS
jgi:hypothetical protein